MAWQRAIFVWSRLIGWHSDWLGMVTFRGLSGHKVVEWSVYVFINWIDFHYPAPWFSLLATVIWRVVMESNDDHTMLALMLVHYYNTIHYSTTQHNTTHSDYHILSNFLLSWDIWWLCHRFPVPSPSANPILMLQTTTIVAWCSWQDITNHAITNIISRYRSTNYHPTIRLLSHTPWPLSHYVPQHDIPTSQIYLNILQCTIKLNIPIYPSQTIARP